ncbi:MAG TPA: YifB family Mg chelatase-like AAA ATPase [Candidatus Dormibacteraeota bacterium]|nr:YifB family Mg chelatase-like AAA ATPase [Candidatus Dormibacteraeota bacterium]
MLATVQSGALRGVDGLAVEVEVDLFGGSPGLAVVGLPEGAVKEGMFRVGAAVRNGGYKYPGGRRIVINLAPADLRKEGSAFDLPIAIGILAASGQLPREELAGYAILGELSLDGAVKAVRGALPIAAGARSRGLRGILLPAANAREAAVVEDLEVRPVRTLGEAVEFLRGDLPIAPTRVDLQAVFNRDGRHDADFADVRGQDGAKRALEVAAAGGHNVLMVGPPGAGKTMLAQRLGTILPPLTLEEAVEATRVHSVLGLMRGRSLIAARPFRAPHHTISDAGLIGGGSIPRPGEVSLAHRGVLFLDELPEFRKNVLEVLRQPLEERRITVARAAGSVSFPADIMLVAAMNPCPCGYLGDAQHRCSCTMQQIQRYRSRVSGPLLDRIDLHVEVCPVPYRELAEARPGEGSAAVRARVHAARAAQLARFAGRRLFCNAQMNTADLRAAAAIDGAASQLLERAMHSLALSARAYTRILKVARTIADLAGADAIAAAHVAEAVQYRTLDRAVA